MNTCGLFERATAVPVKAPDDRSAYARAIDRLSPSEQSEIRSCYRRNPARADTCPDLEHGDYAPTYRAFEPLCPAPPRGNGIRGW